MSAEEGPIKLRKLQISLACGDYDRTRPILDGSVEVEGVDLTPLALEPEETLWRMLRHNEFDVAEMSLAMYVMRLDKGDKSLLGVPIFPSRMFRQSSIYINKCSGIDEPGDLVGKSMGVPEYSITAAVWIRGLLEDDFGVRPQQLRWVTGGLEQPGREDKLPLDPIPNVVIERAAQHQTLNQMLAEGEIQGLIAPRPPSSFVNGANSVTRLFPNFRDVERQYYRRTGIFPIMHLLVMQRPLAEANPWLPQSLAKAFERAKQRCINSMSQTAALRYTLPWMMAEVHDTLALMGEDPWPYGVQNNEKTLVAALSYLHSQGLISRIPSLDELFAPSTLSPFRL